MRSEYVHYLPDAAATRRFGARLAHWLVPGDTLCLYGALGAGKTTLLQGVAAGLAVPGALTSPTFTLVHEHRGGTFPFVHLDVYRLSGPGDLHDLGFDDYLSGDNIVVIEWADRIADALPDERLDIRIEDRDEGETRRLTLTGHGERGRVLCGRIAEGAEPEAEPC